MAIQPTIRTDGSRHLIRFQGNLFDYVPVEGQPRPNGVVTGGALDDARAVIFMLADATDLTDLTAQLPAGVYDDTTPAGSSPHAAGGVWGPAILAGAIDIAGVPTGPAWAQNIRVRADEFSASTAAPLISRADVLMPSVVLDGPAVGLGSDTGIPCVTVLMHFTAAGDAALADQEGGVPVVVEIEVPHTIGR